jgi:FSR family fosmidomycin resistance protein-like MFS transporter
MRLALPIVALILLALLHGLVDTFALFIQPLWPVLERQLQLDSVSVSIAYVIWNLANSGSQLFWGYLGDRYQGRWLLWMGPLAGIVCVSCLGFATSPWILNALLIVGGLGIAAFHPEAAALAGRLAPAHRSRAMSVFAVGGYLGQAVGPYMSGEIVTLHGIGGLAWHATWGVLLLFAITLGLRPASRIDHHVRRETVSISRLLAGRFGAVMLLMTIGTMRVVTSVGVPMALAYLIDSRGGTSAQTGHVQSSYQLGIGLGSIVCAAIVSARHERLALWLTPMFSTPLLWWACGAEGETRIIAMTLAGTCMGGAFPVLISYGQQLLPEGPRVASSLTMGVTWGIGSMIVAATMIVFRDWGRPDWAIYTFAAGGAISSLLCFALPDVHRRT